MPKVTFREERCKGCGHCIEVCPKKIVYHPAIVPQDKMQECIACASCARICPDCVITVEK